MGVAAKASPAPVQVPALASKWVCPQSGSARADHHRPRQSNQPGRQWPEPTPHHHPGHGKLAWPVRVGKYLGELAHLGQRLRARCVRARENHIALCPGDSASSPRNVGLLISVTVPLRACSSSACGGPRHSRAESRTFVSITSRIVSSCAGHAQRGQP